MTLPIKFTILLLLFSIPLFGQFDLKDFNPADIKRMDSIMFTTVYTCNPEVNRSYFTEDLEFYHDVTGATYSLDEFMKIVTANFCGEQSFTLRRELVPGTMEIYPLAYVGAVQTGEHYFYQKRKGEAEKRTGIAKFIHLWRYENGKWKISRVISYDHRAAE